ncbi:hypothetical protein UY3_17976, partial [Chelonia mydas]
LTFGEFMMSSGVSRSKNRQAVNLQGVDPETCMIVFKTHWGQVVKILEKHDPLKNTQAKYGAIPPDEASTVQNYVEHMLFLLIEEQAKDAAMGPILEFVVTENIMEKLFLWSLRREFNDETKIEQLKIYEMLVTQSHQPVLHHKPILKPLMMLLSSCSGTATPAVELPVLHHKPILKPLMMLLSSCSGTATPAVELVLRELVIRLNQLCSILAKDPSILELFFHTSEDQGAANFLIFSLLIPFIHREGTIGQQARDALLFIMSLSAENNVVANHIVENTYFCPVLATGLSGLYSSLPTKLEENGEWHCLLKDDWLLSPALVQFMNSLEFCNAVIQDNPRRLATLLPMPAPLVLGDGTFHFLTGERYTTTEDITILTDLHSPILSDLVLFREILRPSGQEYYEERGCSLVPSTSRGAMTSTEQMALLLELDPMLFSSGGSDIEEGPSLPPPSEVNLDARSRISWALPQDIPLSGQPVLHALGTISVYDGSVSLAILGAIVPVHALPRINTVPSRMPSSCFSKRPA